FLRGPGRFDAAALGRALTAVARHHDMLRAAFPAGGDGPAVIAGPDSAAVPLDRVNVPGGDPAAVERAATELQAAFDPARGGLFAARLFAADDADHLLLAAHHLVVDAVSWGPILADLATAYRQAAAGEEIALAPKTASYRDWVAALDRHAQSPELAREAAYWSRAAESARQHRLFHRPDGPAGQDQAANLSVRAALDPERSAALAGPAPEAYSTDVLTLVLTGVARAVRSAFGVDWVPIDVETHGRHELSQPIALDRTVGWFTSLHPLVADVSGDPGDAIVRVKEALAAVPGHGVGYQLLTARGVVPAVTPGLAVNYLGAADNAPVDGIGPSPWPVGASISPRDRLHDPVVVDCGMAGGRAYWNITYDPSVLDQATAAFLAESIAQATAELVDHCAGQGARVRTASDFGGTELDGAELLEIADLLG
ncbi:MAG: condensation domain-containing protein, partial [Bifidobacteriaceae bacterium]|nr:condensation domain-containing protein [Bifidobacteriaceae bacterium]